MCNNLLRLGRSLNFQRMLEDSTPSALSASSTGESACHLAFESLFRGAGKKTADQTEEGAQTTCQSYPTTQPSTDFGQSREHLVVRASNAMSALVLLATNSMSTPKAEK